CGNWAEQSDSEKLDYLEIFQVYCEFIPKYIQKGFPMDMLLYRTAIFDAQKKKYALFYEFATHGENRNKASICRNFRKELNISPQGYLSPCYGLMGDDAFIKTMPNLNEISLREALTDSEFVKYVTLTSSDIINHNEECTNCIYKSKCGGGCRLSAYLNNQSFMSCDPVMCSMLENGYDVLLKSCIHEAYITYKMKTM
ncbi:MAG: SPASM domain-containing protein, partial [Ruminococcus sp.]